MAWSTRGNTPQGASEIGTDQPRIQRRTHWRVKPAWRWRYIWGSVGLLLILAKIVVG